MIRPRMPAALPSALPAAPLSVRLMSRTALCSCLLALVAGPLAAQQASDATVVLDPVNLRAETGEDAATGAVGDQLAPPTLTGAKTATPLNEVPQSVSVIGSEQLEAQNIRKVDEALRYSAGVFTQPFGDDSDTDWHFIRGFQSTATGVYRDGLQNYSYAFGGFYTDPFLLERIEVLRGASSVLYGGSNPGGLLNYVSKRPGDTHSELTFGVNDAGTAWAGFDFGRQVAQGFGTETAWRLLGRIEGGDKYDDWASGGRLLLAPSVTTTLDTGTRITLSADYTKIDEEHSGGSFLPYYGSVVATDEFGYIDPEANFSEPSLDSYKREQKTLSAEIVQPLGSGWTLTETARLGTSHVRERSLYAYGYTGYALQPADAVGTLARIDFQHDTTTQTALSDTRLEGEVQTGALTHRLLFGLDLKWFRLDQMQASTAIDPSISVVDPQYGSVTGSPVPYIDQALIQRQAGLYAQDQIRWGDGWIATLNLRQDYAETHAGENTAVNAASPEGSDRSDSQTSWRVGLAKEFANGLTPYASASTYFLPQVVNDAGGNAVSPETGEQYEVGVKWAMPDNRTMLTFAAFDLTRQNVLQQQYDFGIGGYVNYQVGEQRSRGVELELVHDFGNGLTLRATGTKYDLEIERDVNSALEGNTPYNVPEEMATLWADYAFSGAAEGWRLGGGLRYYGASWADNENTLRVPSVTLADLAIGYSRDDWTANLAVSNLEDKRYVASCQGAYSCGYGAGREVSLTLSRRW